MLQSEQIENNHKSNGRFTVIVVLFFVGLSVGCFNFLKALEKKN